MTRDLELYRTYVKTLLKQASLGEVKEFSHFANTQDYETVLTVQGETKSNTPFAVKFLFNPNFTLELQSARVQLRGGMAFSFMYKKAEHAFVQDDK